jgi:hypothetical protein
MKFKNQSLDELAKSHTKIIVFDCEFWHVYGNQGFLGIKGANNEFFMPREVGGFFLQKLADGSWSYKKPFFVTLHPPKDKEVSYISSAFSNVTKETAQKMDKYQSILSVNWRSAYLNKLPEDLHDTFLEGQKVYLNDPNIKEAHKPPSWVKNFVEELSDSVVIVKGSYDLVSLENACRYHGFQYKKPKKIIDIVDWNSESTKICGTAKLEGTYECIKDELEPETANMLKFLPLGRAHDPSSDAAMTLVIALHTIHLTKP